jgi:hypothetical protein
VIRNAVIHLANEQPLLADLFAPPNGADTSLVCTNLRTMNGARPVFADHGDSLFVFPYAHIRFVEVAASALAAAEPMLEAGDDGRGHGRRNGSGGKAAPGQRTDIGAAAIAAAMAETARAAAGAAAAVAASEPAVPSEGPPEDAEAAGPVDDLDQELEIDEDFLRRVREI